MLRGTHASVRHRGQRLIRTRHGEGWSAAPGSRVNPTIEAVDATELGVGEFEQPAYLGRRRLAFRLRHSCYPERVRNAPLWLCGHVPSNQWLGFLSTSSLVSKAPIIRQYAWASAPWHLFVGSMLVVLARLAFGLTWLHAIIAGCLIYIAIARLTRATVARHHTTGMRHVKAGDFAEAIPHFERSLDYFTRYGWIDRWRFLLLGASSRASYREMALVNIAFCYAQAGDGPTARRYYERAVAEYPESVLGRAGLRMAESFGPSRPIEEA